MPLVSAWQNFDLLRVADRCHDRVTGSFSSSAVLHGEDPWGVVNSFCFSFVLFFFNERCNLRRKKNVTINSHFLHYVHDRHKGELYKTGSWSGKLLSSLSECLFLSSVTFSHYVPLSITFVFYSNEDTSHGIMHVHLEINPKCAF